MYGTQAPSAGVQGAKMFENDVKMYGTQAFKYLWFEELEFENDVKMYGTQAKNSSNGVTDGLRMM